MAVIALLVAFLPGPDGGGPLDLRSRGAGLELAAALHQYAQAPAVHETGAFRHDGHRYEVNVTIDRDGDSQGTVVADGREVEYRYTGDHAYVLAGRARFAHVGGRCEGSVTGHDPFYDG